jgi:hypothetical protein
MTSTGDNSSFDVQVIDDAGSLDVLGDALRELDRKYPPETAYLSADFLVHWLLYASARSKLHTMLLSDNGLVKAVLPLVSDEVKRGPLTIARLGFPTRGGHPPSFDLRLGEKSAAPAAELLLTTFSKRGAPWKVLSLRHLSGNSPLLHLLPDMCGKRGLSFSWFPARRESYLVLDGDWESYLARLDGKHRREVNRGFRRIEDAAGWEFVDEWPGEDGVVGLLDRYLKVVRGSWKSDEADDAGFVELLDRVMRSFARKGDLLVSWLRGPGADGAALIQLRRGRVLSAYHTAYTKECPVRGAGTELFAHAIHNAYETGTTIYDYSTYAEHIHRWRPLYRNTVNVYITKKTLSGRLIQRQMKKRESRQLSL